MATPVMDVGLLNFFSPLFIFLLLFAVIYALFQWTKIFGDNKVIHSMIAVVLALFGSIFSPSARGLIEFIMPWFTFLVIIGVVVIVLFKMFGVSDDSLTSAVKSPGVMWTILILVIVLIIGALSHVFGQNQLAYTSDTQSAGIGADQTGGLSDLQQGGETGLLNPGGHPGTKDTDTGDIQKNIGATFYHPRVLGMIFILIIAAMAIRMLSAPSTPL